MNISVLFRKIYASRFDQMLLGLFFLVVILIALQKKSAPAQISETETPAADTYIPPGFVLVPLRLENHQSVDSVVTQFAVVNIYKGAPGPNQKSQLLGRNLRLLRAPLNPQQFAVLVPESQVDPFMNEDQKLHAVLQNRASAETSELPTNKKVRKVTFY